MWVFLIFHVNVYVLLCVLVEAREEHHGTLTLLYSFGRQSFTEYRDTVAATDPINPVSVSVALGLHVCTWFYPTFYMCAGELNSRLKSVQETLLPAEPAPSPMINNILTFYL